MSPHLSDEALVEMAEASASRRPDNRPEAEHAHLAGCARCRQVFEDALATLMRLGAVDVAEPSPLFWSRLSARVHDAIESDEVAVQPARAWLPSLGWRSAVLAGVMVLVAVLLGSQIASRRHEVPAPAFVRGGSHVAPATLPSQALPATAVSEEVEASWQFVTEMTATADFETATQAGGFALQPGAAERAALQLSPDEQRELVRLLQEAVDGVIPPN